MQELKSMLQDISDDGVNCIVYQHTLSIRIPKFLYFDEYYQMKGQENLDALMERGKNDALEEPDHPLLGLIDLAGLDLNQLVAPGRTESLLAKLEAAENQLHRKCSLIGPRINTFG